MAVTAPTLESQTVEVRCYSETCAKKEGNQRRMFFLAEKGCTGTIFLTCPRCGAYNVIDLAART